jgi:hypothetical protein
LADAKRRLAQRKGRPINDETVSEMEIDLEPVVLARPVLRRGGRREWFRVARSELEAHRARQAAPIARDREDRLLGVLGRFEENQRVDVVANEAYDRWRASARDTKGRVLKGNSKPFTPPTMPDGVINLSDSDSRVMHTQGTPPRQAYNAQAAVNDQQVILAAEISIAAPDFGHLAPMPNTTLAGLHQRGITEVPEVVLADAGHWHTAEMQAIAERGIEVLIPPDGNMRQGKRPGWDDRLYQQMRDTPRCLRPRFSGLPSCVERLGHEWNQDAVAKRYGLGLGHDQRQVLDGPFAGGDPIAVANEPDRLVAKAEADKDAVDCVLELTEDAVVVLSRHDQIGVTLGDLAVPTADDRVEIGRI